MQYLWGPIKSHNLAAVQDWYWELELLAIKQEVSHTLAMDLAQTWPALVLHYLIREGNLILGH